MSRGIRLSDRVFIAGMTGKGKTTLALWLLERLQPIRTIVFDPKGELEFPGVVPCRTPLELGERLGEPLVHYIPASFDREALEEACELVWLCPGPYVWLIDETSEVSSPSYCPAGLRLAVTQGRKPRKMVIALTQRLAETHPVFRSQSEHVFVFVPPPIELDLKELAKAIRREPKQLGAELAELHQAAGDFSHLWYVRDTDELRRCAPLPGPDDPGGQVQAPTAPEGEGGDSESCDSSDSASELSSRPA